jgi:hypothetical protein
MVKGTPSTVLLQSVLLAIIFSPGQSREWKPTRAEVFEDYSSINHKKSDDEFITLKWMVAPLVPSNPLEALVEKYVIISALHYRLIMPGGTVSVEDIAKLDAFDINGHPPSPPSRKTNCRRRLFKALLL